MKHVETGVLEAIVLDARRRAAEGDDLEAAVPLNPESSDAVDGMVRRVERSRIMSPTHHRSRKDPPKSR